jgi:hypothetical protein
VSDAESLPPQQDLSSEHVIQELSRYGIHRILDTSIPVSLRSPAIVLLFSCFSQVVTGHPDLNLL